MGGGKKNLWRSDITWVRWLNHTTPSEPALIMKGSIEKPYSTRKIGKIQVCNNLELKS